MPVRRVWLDRRLWSSSGVRSRKARNLAADPRCAMTTDDARNPVIALSEGDFPGSPTRWTFRAG
jgi:hypothetical protein